MAKTQNFIQLSPNDSVVVATRDLPAETVVDLHGPVQLLDPIPMGHKLAIRPVPQGADVTKYGHAIGVAKRAIQPGHWVHTHNLTMGSDRSEFQYATDAPKAPLPIRDRTFMGYRRANGKAGTRNYIAVISNVNCSATVSKNVAAHFTSDALRDYPNVDGVIALTHHGGCAMQFAGQQHQILNRVMAGMARHPNVGGFVLIGLGCEQANLDYLIDSQRLVQIDQAPLSSKSVPVLTIQSTGGTTRTIREGIRVVEQLLPMTDDVRREPIPAGELILATQCGGSDGSSGITANRAVGVASDLNVACGGTTVLAETTEVVGAEHLLTRRSSSEQVGRKLVERIQWWRWYANIFGEQIDDNRSAGNEAGGLTTITEKSLGAIAKAGSTTLMDVYDYAEPITSPGLVLMDTPGFDPCSITGMVAGGANMIVFTTGRGSCYGCKPVPSIKIATNTPMFQRMSDDMDVDAGRILTGTPVEQVGQDIFEMILATASGEKTKSEIHGIGDEEFVPWMIGPVL